MVSSASRQQTRPAAVPGRKLRVCLVTLGCPKNQVDSENALGLLQANGFGISAEPEQADILIINTCAFIRTAEEETIQAVTEAARLKQRGQVRLLLVVGCWAAKHGVRKLRQLVPEIDGVAMPNDPERWLCLIREVLGPVPAAASPRPSSLGSRPLLSGPGSAFVKIAEGCSRRCTFCLIPSLRGPLKSRPSQDIVREILGLAGRGISEIVLVAQDTTQYGRDLTGRPGLTALLKKLVRIPGPQWLRVMYLNPDGIDAPLLGLLARERSLCSYLDVPVQHAHPRILKAMGRRGSAPEFLKLIERIRRSIPGVTLRTTLIAGFPGETEAEHRSVLDFVRAARFDRLGVFSYSPEPGTRAAALAGQVHPRTRERRCREIMDIQAGISRASLAGKVGRVLECLVEEAVGPRQWLGRTQADAPEVDGGVVLNGRGKPGTIVRARITGSTDHDLRGNIL